jgi:hypothetical protein
MEIRVVTDIDTLVFTIPKIKRSTKIVIHQKPVFISTITFTNSLGKPVMTTLVDGFTRKDPIVFIQNQMKDNFYITLNYRFCNKATLFLKTINQR